jgi:transcriptional regulator with XRE-family HTH domain
MRTRSRTVQIRRACAQTVRSLRLKAGLSQERLVRELGIDRGNLAGLERGLHTPTLYTMCRLLPGLHVTFI